MLCGRRAVVTLSQHKFGSDELVAVSTDVESGEEVMARFSVADLRAASMLSTDTAMASALKALERAIVENRGGGELDKSVSFAGVDDRSATAARDDLDDIETRLLHAGRGPHAMADYAAPEQEALQPHDFLTNPTEPTPHSQISDKTDMFSFGVLLCHLISGAPRRMAQSQAINGLKFRLESPEETVAHAFPPSAREQSRLLDILADLAQHCMSTLPEHRPTAAIAVSLLESALAVVGATVDPKIPGPDDVVIPADQQRMNEAKYYMYARRDWVKAAELLMPFMPDERAALPVTVDWKPMLRMLRGVKQALVEGGNTASVATFPYSQMCLRVRGMPGALRVRMFPLHDVCRWGSIVELDALLAIAGDNLMPGVIRREMDKYWTSDVNYVRALRDLSLKVGRKPFKALLLDELDDDGESLLRLACAGGHEKIVDRLLRNHADVNAADVSGSCHRAVGAIIVVVVMAVFPCSRSLERRRCTKLVLQGALRLSRLSWSGVRSLTLHRYVRLMPERIAAFYREVAVIFTHANEPVCAFPEHGHVPNARRSSQRTCAHREGAAGLGCEPRCIRCELACHVLSAGLLFERGLLMTVCFPLPQGHGRLPIHIACALGFVDVVKTLISYGCNVMRMVGALRDSALACFCCYACSACPTGAKTERTALVAIHTSQTD